ncbi:MAG: hypothetical protein A2Z45_08930 [Chloroflexi bacterium RBG_19FT_COMBO_55_16]|nr:MAG: hypothetical protein A2Z45_08930 [Chloroflexi bacterium RBG_19FT_COMBO_55_16]
MAKSYLESLLSENEKILRVARQHWFILVSTIILEIVLILVILVLAIILGVLFPPFAWLIAGVGAILILIPILTMVRDILNWLYRQFIVTNRRVMQISGIFNKNVTDSSLEKVNDVKMVQSALGRIFDYGDIQILTASELGVNLFRRIEDPIKFKTAMLNAKERLERGEFDLKNRGEDIPTLLANLEQLRQQGVLTEEEFQRKKAELLAKM